MQILKNNGWLLIAILLHIAIRFGLGNEASTTAAQIAPVATLSSVSSLESQATFMATVDYNIRPDFASAFTSREP